MSIKGGGNFRIDLVERGNRPCALDEHSWNLRSRRYQGDAANSVIAQGKRTRTHRGMAVGRRDSHCVIAGGRQPGEASLTLLIRTGLPAQADGEIFDHE